MITLPLEKLQALLEKKSRSYSAVLEEKYKWYDVQFKLLAIEMEELRERIENQDITLQGN